MQSNKKPVILNGEDITYLDPDLQDHMRDNGLSLEDLVECVRCEMIGTDYEFYSTEIGYFCECCRFD